MRSCAWLVRKLLPGASGFLRYLKGIGILYAIAASGQPAEGRPAVLALELPPGCSSSQEFKRIVRSQTLIFFGPRPMHWLHLLEYSVKEIVVN